MTLPLIPVAIVFLGTYNLARWAETSKDERGEFLSPVNTISLMGIFLAAMMMPVLLVSFFIGVLIVLISSTWTARRTARKDASRFGEHAKRHRPLYSILTAIPSLLFAFVILGTLTLLMFSWTWLPTENITIKGQKPIVGQVLSSTGEWTKYLENGRDRQAVHIVRTPDIESRTPCNANDTNSYNSVANYLLRRGKSGPQDNCPR